MDDKVAVAQAFLHYDVGVRTLDYSLDALHQAFQQVKDSPLQEAWDPSASVARLPRVVLAAEHPSHRMEPSLSSLKPE